MGGVDEEDGAGVIAGFDLHFLHCACEVVAVAFD